MNQAFRIAEAMEVIHRYRLQTSSTHPLVKEVATLYSSIEGYYTYYSMGTRSIEIEVEKSGPHTSVVMVKLVNEEADHSVIVLDYDETRGSIGTWLHEGSWCTLIDSMIDVAESYIKEELVLFDKTFRLPSVVAG